MTCLRAKWLLLVAALLWGTGNVANKSVLEDIGPFTAVAIRSGLAAFVLVPLALRDRSAPAASGWWRSSIALSVLFTCAVTLQQWAYLYASVTNASFLVNCSTVLTPLIAWALYGHRQHRMVVIAAFLCLGGAAAMSLAGGPLQRLNPGDMACLASAAMYAFWYIAQEDHARRFGKATATTCIQCALCAAFVCPIALGAEDITPVALLRAAPELIYLGIFSTALAFALTLLAQSRVSATTAAVILSAESLFGAAGAFVVLGERSTFIAVMGAGLILLGIVMTTVAPDPAQAARQSGNSSFRKLARRIVSAG